MLTILKEGGLRPPMVLVRSHVAEGSQLQEEGTRSYLQGLVHGVDPEQGVESSKGHCDARQAPDGLFLLAKALSSSPCRHALYVSGRLQMDLLSGPGALHQNLLTGTVFYEWQGGLHRKLAARWSQKCSDVERPSSQQ